MRAENNQQGNFRTFTRALNLDLGTPINTDFSFGQMRVAFSVGKTDNSHAGRMRRLHPGRRVLNYHTLGGGQAKTGGSI